jgi:MFS family permease
MARWPQPTPRTVRAVETQVLLCGAVIVTLSMGIRHGFGLWLQPSRSSAAEPRDLRLCLAVQNLAWGIAAPLAGMLADRWGAFRVLALAASSMRPAWS